RRHTRSKRDWSSDVCSSDLFSGLNEEIHADIHVKDCDIIDASYQAIGFIEGNVFGVVFENLFINGTGTYVIQIQGGGDATFKNEIGRASCRERRYGAGSEVW